MKWCRALFTLYKLS